MRDVAEWYASRPDVALVFSGKVIKEDVQSGSWALHQRSEQLTFLAAVQEVCWDWQPFFLTALRAGLRKGELIALKWGDIQFGENEGDSNRYILVQRNFSHGGFTTPKSKSLRLIARHCVRLVRWLFALCELPHLRRGIALDQAILNGGIQDGAQSADVCSMHS